MVHPRRTDADTEDVQNPCRILRGIGQSWRSRVGGATPEDSGAILVELALILPFLVTFIFGVVDLGRAWYLKNQVTNAAREGAVVAQYRPGFVRSGCEDGNNVFDRADREADAGAITVTIRNVTRGTTIVTAYDGEGTAPCTAAAPGSIAGDQIAVTVNAEFKVLTPAIAVISGQQLDVTGFAQVVMQG